MTEIGAVSSASEVGTDAHAVGPVPIFYRIVPARISFEEFLWGGKPLEAVLAWVLTHVFRVEIATSSDDPAVESLAPFERQLDSLSAVEQQAFAAATARLEELGFFRVACHRIDDWQHSTGTVLVTFAHAQVPTLARLHVRVWAFKTPAPFKWFLEFISETRDGRCIWTAGAKPDLRTPPNCVVWRRDGVTFDQAWEAHQTAQRAAGGEFVPVPDRATALSLAERHHACIRDFHLARGVFRRYTPEDERRLKIINEAVRASAQVHSKHPTLQAEVALQLQKQTGWAGAVVLLLVSVVAFLGAGSLSQGTLLGVLGLVPILLFHEAGHYVAMKAFGYSNVRMFFVPWLGAAVVGRHFNVPGWQRAVVSLMGPMPGILVGIVIGACGVVFKHAFLLKAASLIVLLNGFNLLPILPLDGGHLAHTVLFSRHVALDVAFRVIAALALFAAALAAKLNFAIFLAVMVLLGLPYALRMHRVAAQVRAQGVATASEDGRTVPPLAVDRITEALIKDAKKPAVNTVLAQQVLGVFEAMNTRPPGWFASAGIVATHVFGLIVAAVFGFVFLIARDGDLQNLVRAGASMPRQLVKVSEFEACGDGESVPTAVVVATFKTDGEASTFHARLCGEGLKGLAATRIGASLFVTVPAGDDARRAMLDRLEKEGATAFVHGPAMKAIFRIFAAAPSEQVAQEIERELSDYFRLPGTDSVVPPWEPGFSVTPEQAAARRTLALLLRTGAHEDAAYKEFAERIAQARRRGEAEQVTALQAELDRVYREAERREIVKAIDTAGGTIDTVLAGQYKDAYDARSDTDFYTWRRTAFLDRLGAAGPIDEKGVVRPSTGTPSTSGWVSRAVSIVRVEYVSFLNPGAGADAMCRWLNARGCKNIRLEVKGEERWEESDE